YSRGGEAEIVLLEDSVGAVARSNERAGCDFGESAREPPFAIGREFVRMYPARDRQVVSSGAQILPERQHVHIARSQIVHCLGDLVVSLAEAEEQERLSVLGVRGVVPVSSRQRR